MTDYLEKLFSRQSQQQAGEEELSRPVLPAGEQVQWRQLSEPEEESVKEMTLPSVGEGEVIFRSLRRGGEEPVGESRRESLVLRRPAEQRAQESLERRLRRESRRYDSGFYLY